MNDAPRRGAATRPRPVASDVRWDATGLVPGIVQDAADGRVLMLGWLDAEALAATLETGSVHFHSRSRDRLWRKGETSGHELRLIDVALDCDADALLLTVEPVGPTCHTGTRSCFDGGRWTLARAADRADPVEHVGADRPAAAPQGFAWLETLWATVASRAAERPAGSYTVGLLDGGVDAVGRKIVEEATEVLIAAKDDATADRLGDREAARAALAGELADLLFHTLVLCAERSLPPAVAVAVLRERHAARTG